MRVIFMGTSDFSIPILDALATHHDVVAVCTRPDAKSGRGNKLRPSPIKSRATELGLPVMTPDDLSGEDCANELRSLSPDVIVVSAYGVILPRAVLDIPPYGCLNIHASLLPRWRGAAPIQRAILAGDDVVGVSIMRMEEGLDTGDYCWSLATPVDDEDAAQLSADVSQLGAKAIIHALDSIASGSLNWHKQDESLVTYADKLRKDEVLLDPGLDVVTALRRIRASGKNAPARCVICGKPVTVTAAHLLPSEEAGPDAPSAGCVSLAGRRLVLGFPDGALLIDRIKPDGKQEMDASSWVGGLRDVECTWEALS